MKFVVIALFGLFASVAVATPPPAPTITAAATDIKQLQFDITPVPRIGWYELWFRALPGAEWVNFANSPSWHPLFRINTQVHLLDWQQARFYVKACNPSGCTSSNEVGVDGEALDAMGYFKPPRSGPYQYFGFNFAVSQNGKTMAVLAAESFGGVHGTAAIHVYRKTTSTSGWRHEARIVPSTSTSGSGASVAGDPIAISWEGDVIAFGSWMENDNTGAVYVFRREYDGWHESQKITGDNSENDSFGTNVKLKEFGAGMQLVVGHGRTGGAHPEGTIEVYTDSSGSPEQFVHVTTVETPEVAKPAGYCRGFDLSGVGYLVRSCYGGHSPSDFFTQVLTVTTTAPFRYLETARLSGGTGGDVAIDFLGERLAVQDFDATALNRVLVFRRDASGWTREGVLAPFPAQQSHIGISGDGKIVAIGSTDDTLAGRGPLFAPYENGDPSGSVAVYERRTSGWRLRRFLKAGANNVLHSFGWEVSLDQYGRVLAVGSPYDASKTAGIDGDREDTSVPDRGAVWLY
jgi:hypothetical protein